MHFHPYSARATVFEQLQLLAKAKATEELLEDISAYDSAIAARPGDGKLYCARGEAFAQLQEFEKAVADYGRAISFSPTTLITSWAVNIFTLAWAI